MIGLASAETHLACDPLFEEQLMPRLFDFQTYVRRLNLWLRAQGYDDANVKRVREYYAENLPLTHANELERVEQDLERRFE